MLSGVHDLLLVDVNTAGTARIMKTIDLYFPCARVIQWNGRIVVEGEEGFATVDLTNGEASRFCTSPLGSRWAFVGVSGSVHFANGSHLMRAHLPKQGN
jgi:hypothetical protein